MNKLIQDLVGPSQTSPSGLEVEVEFEETAPSTGSAFAKELDIVRSLIPLTGKCSESEGHWSKFLLLLLLLPF